LGRTQPRWEAEHGERVGSWRNLDNLDAIDVRAGERVEGIDFDLVPQTPVGG
jgi:hypothetical protein